MPHSMLSVATAAASAIAMSATAATAGVLYSVPGSIYTENFNGLPTAPAPGGTSGTVLSNNTIMQGAGAGYTTGWVNDTDYATSADPYDIGVKGFYLFHPIVPTGGLAGPTGHSRLNQGNGTTSGAGGFWAFNSGTDTTSPAYAEKALGSVGTSVGTTAITNTSNPIRMGFEVVNTTNSVLSSFTLTYDGEQYMDGRSATPETLLFDYSLNDTAASYTTAISASAAYTAVPSLNFLAPNSQNYGNGSTGNAALVVDGNLPENRVANLTATITGLEWQPGTSLWLRWTDTFAGSGNNDGLAIDNVRFSAVPEPTGFGLIAVGLAAFGRRRRTRSS